MVQCKSAALPVFRYTSVNRAAPLPLSLIGRIQILIWGILGAAIFDCVIRSSDLFNWFIDEQAGFQLYCGQRLKLGKADHFDNSYYFYLYFFISQFGFQS